MSPSKTGTSRSCCSVLLTNLSLAVISILRPHFLQIINPDLELGIIILLQSGQNSILQEVITRHIKVCQCHRIILENIVDIGKEGK